MNKEQLRGIINKYRKLAETAAKDHRMDKAQECEEFARFVEENFDLYQDEAYQNESELWEDYESISNGESVFGNAFGDDDDE